MDGLSGLERRGAGSQLAADTHRADARSDGSAARGLYASAGPPDWVLADGTSPTRAGGLVGGVSNLWAEDGTLLAASTTQMICRPNPTYEPDLAEQNARARQRAEG